MITYYLNIDRFAPVPPTNCESSYLVLTKYTIVYEMAARKRNVEIEAPSPLKALRLFLAGIPEEMKKFVTIVKIV